MHYGTLEEAVVYTTKNSFHTHGKIACMDLKAGKAVAEDKGYVALVKAANDTEIQEVDTGVFYIPTNSVVADIDTTVAASIGYVSNGETTPSYVVDITTAKGQERAQTISSNAYEISDKNELIAFRNAWNSGNLNRGMTFVLTRDIDMTGENWYELIGNEQSISFEGTFDGKGYKINNLSNNGKTSTSIATDTSGNPSDGTNYGLFGWVSGTTSIKNLDIYTYVYTAVSNSITGGVYAKSDNVNADVTIENVKIYGSISGTKYVGGFIGQHTKGKLTIKNCENHAAITSSSYASGFLGGSAEACANKLTFINCLNAGDITANGSNPAAGIVANLNMAKQNVEITYSKTSDQKWADVINGPSFTSISCSNVGNISGSKKSDLYYDLGMSDDNIKTLNGLTLGNSYAKRVLLAYYNNTGSNRNWEDCDTYGILAGLAYDLNLEGDYAAFVGDCHATTIGKAAAYQNSVDKSLVINVKKDFDTVDIHGSVNFENHSGNQINVKTNDTLTLSNGTLAKIKINNANARVTLINMTVTGSVKSFSEDADIYLQTDDVLSIVSGTYSFNPTSYLAQGSLAQDNGNGTWTVTANN